MTRLIISLFLHLRVANEWDHVAFSFSCLLGKRQSSPFYLPLGKYVTIRSLVTHIYITKVYMYFLFAVLQVPPADCKKAEWEQRHRGYVWVPSVPLHPCGHTSAASEAAQGLQIFLFQWLYGLCRSLASFSVNFQASLTLAIFFLPSLFWEVRLVTCPACSSGFCWFYGVGSLAPCPSLNLEDQGITFSLDDHPWTFQQGKPCQ
jgi:hypothetical protein